MHFFFHSHVLNVTGKKRLLHKTQDQFLLDGHIFSHACDRLIEKYIQYMKSLNPGMWRRTRDAQWRQAVFVPFHPSTVTSHRCYVCVCSEVGGFIR